MQSMETKVTNRSVVLKSFIDQLYMVFSRYEATDLDVCSACYTVEQIAVLKMVSASHIDTFLARKLLWEAKDHWASSSVYKYFLPRILEVMVPPELEEDLFPTHLIEVLQHFDFASWPSDEKSVVLQFLEHVAPLIHHDVDDCSEFEEALSSVISQS